MLSCPEVMSSESLGSDHAECRSMNTCTNVVALFRALFFKRIDNVCPPNVHCFENLRNSTARSPSTHHLPLRSSRQIRYMIMHAVAFYVLHSRAMMHICDDVYICVCIYIHIYIYIYICQMELNIRLLFFFVFTFHLLLSVFFFDRHLHRLYITRAQYL